MKEACMQKYQNPKFLETCGINIGEDPIRRLNEIVGNVEFNSTLIAGVHNKCCFKVTVAINGINFSATGTTLKFAKRLCALIALENLYCCSDDKIIRKQFKVKKSVDKIMCKENIAICSYYQNKESSLKSSRERKILLPLAVDQNENVCEKFDEKRVLQNIENDTCLPDSIFTSLKTTTDKTNPILKLSQVLKNKLKTCKFAKKCSTIEFASEESVEVKVCLKTYSKNPIQLEDSALLTGKLGEPKKQQINFKPCKRLRDEDIESTQQPPIKKRITKALCDLIHNKWRKHTSNELKCLQNLQPYLSFNLEAEIGSSLAPFFLMSAQIGDRKFFGHGKAQSIATKDAAVQVLNYLKNTTTEIPFSGEYSATQVNLQKCQQINLYKEPKNENFFPFMLPSYIADVLESKVMHKFDELTGGHQEIREYKVLAGIVMTHNMNFEQAQVVSIATGTKCINGGNICCNGTVLNDSHAEIIAKRGLIKFLYGQLRRHCNGLLANSNSIFGRNSNGSQMPYYLKPDIHFYLYISTAPCGDARVFSFNHQNNYSNTTNGSFNSVQNGQLRTKIEGELGTNPVGTRYHPQTWDGVLLGEPLHTMSCSDKIVGWNVFGIQGALLSQFINPIYLHSIILGSMFNGQHMYRAVCGRIQHTLGFLPAQYRLNSPLLGHTSRPIRRCTDRVPAIGINWFLGASDVEVISLPTGQIYQIRYITNHYGEAKGNVQNYQKAKTELFAAFYRAALGTWVKKPAEENRFVMSLYQK